MYSFGIEREYVLTNPVTGTKQKSAGLTKRDRVYTDREIQILWMAFDQQAEPVRTYLKMLLLLAQRKTETARMKWSDIDFDLGVWTIPEADTKGKRKHVVPLPGMAVDMLKELHLLTGRTSYVFCSHIGDQPIKWVQQMMYRIRKIEHEEQAVSDFKIHDLRRTAASNMAALGVDRTILGKLLNHAGLAGDNQVTAIYDRHEYISEIRQALDRWAHRLQAVISGEALQARIIKMRG
jgi:integrase